MANNRCEFSAGLDVPKDKIDKVHDIIERAKIALENHEDYGYCACLTQVREDYVWLYSEGDGVPEHAEAIAAAIIDELDIATPFDCSYALTCDKPRLGEFGGGAFKVRKGQPTIWADAQQTLNKLARYSDEVGVQFTLSGLIESHRYLRSLNLGCTPVQQDDYTITIDELRNMTVQDVADLLEQTTSGNKATIS